MLFEEIQRKEEAETKKLTAPSIATAAGDGPNVTPRPKQYCNSGLGVVDAGIQVSGKLAKCRHCFKPISRGCPRIGWAYSRSKFHAWVHAGCFQELLSNEHGDVQQAVDYLVTWLERHRDHDGALGIGRVVQALAEVAAAQSCISASAAASSSTGH
eukprot:Skav204413  [mRNA]  locus=scaffold398:208241:208708:+ [translate_table: standard]